MDDGTEEVVKTWTKDEISQLKSDLKSDYKKLLKARDLWSALQLEAWVQNLNLDIRFSTPLGRAYIGNPLYAFPFDVRTFFDHGDWVAVASEDRFHFINGEGRPIAASVEMPFWIGQSAITSDRKIVSAMHLRLSGDDLNPQSHYRVAIKNIEDDKMLMHTGWLDVGEPVSRHYEHESALAFDGSAVALSFRANDRRKDFVWVARPGKGNFRIAELRSVIGLGSNGRWALGRTPQGNRLTFVHGDKRHILHDGDSQSGYAAIIYKNGKTIEFVDRSGKRTALPLQTSTESAVWAMDKWLVVYQGSIKQKQADAKDLFGNVTKAGKETNVMRAVCYRWEDLAAGNKEPSHEIIGNLRLNLQRHDSLLSFSGNKVTIHDCSADTITASDFANLEKPVHDLRIRDNGIRVMSDEEYNYMLNYHGKVIWEGQATHIEMCHPMVMLHEKTGTDKDNKDIPPFTKQKLFLFSDNGDVHNFDLPTPDNGLRYKVDIHQHLHYGRLEYDNRNWLYFSMGDGKIIRNGHVKEDAELVSKWGFPQWSRYIRGRFNRFGGRLIPKWVHKKQAAADRFMPRDAMYARGGLMVITEEDKLYRYDKKLVLDDALTAAQLSYGQLKVQNKDLNTYVTCWMGNSHKAKYFIDKSGNLRNIKDPAEVEEQHPEGEWQIDRRQLYIPRRGKVQWPQENIGFNPWKLRSRSGVSSLLIIARSMIIELDSSTAKKIFPPR